MDELANLDIGGKGILIHYNGETDITELPIRNSMLNIDDMQTMARSISKCSTIYFMPVDIIEPEFYKPYYLKIFGSLITGEKAEINIMDIEVFFDILIPTDTSSTKFNKELSALFYPLCNRFHIKDIYAYPLHGFKKEKSAFKRVYTESLYDRNLLLNMVKNELKLETYSNDSNFYYRKVSREHKLSLCKWVTLRNYKHEYNGIHKFTLDIKDYNLLTDEKALKNVRIIKDKTLLIAWDIETYSDRKTGEVPSPEHIEDNVFMICMTLHWIHETNAFYKICLVDKETETDERWTTIVCKTEYNILKAMAICWCHFMPDIYSGYNDSGYDWNFVVEKAVQYDILPWMWNKMSLISKKMTTEEILKRQYFNRRYREIKINAERRFESRSLVVPGTICIDCLPCFMKVYPRSETTKYGSLKFYLQDNNLPNKVDLPIPVLWKYYTNGVPNELREIAYYCIIDTVSVQRLLVKRNILSDYREISSLAYVSLSDAHYYAGGVKVCNLLGSYAWEADILVNTNKDRTVKTEKYPGAYVFPPDKGMIPNVERINRLKTCTENKLEEVMDSLCKDRPVVCFDFASLYPSLIITYNLSPEKIILTKEEHDYWINQGYRLHEITFKLGNRQKLAWSILHENKETEMGLFPIILKQLFAKRKEMKTLLKTITEKKEVYELIFSKGTNFKDIIIELMRVEQNSTKIVNILQSIDFTKIKEEYDNICFECNYINTKQNALKIYMNTFYGETGNHLSPYFLLELAGGVTSAGQYNLNLVANYVKSTGHLIKYGDTDSVYITCPNKLYRECDLNYARGIYSKEEYYTAMVKNTLNLLHKMEQDINEYIAKDNGTNYLRMESEGCNFPCLFLGKKKYFGIQHVTEVNFKPKKLYIKGVDVIKQGKSRIEKEIGAMIMNQAVSVDNELDILTIVEKALSDAIKTDKWVIDDFIQTSSWKPNKKNVSVQRFMKRMEWRHAIEKKENEELIRLGKEPNKYLYAPLEPGERFSYVLIDTDLLYDIRGRKISIKQGDIMEYVYVAREQNMKINVVYYLVHYIIGICARFINSSDKFLSSDKLLDDKEIDEQSMKAAKKYLEEYIKQLRNISSEQLDIIGKQSKQLFKHAFDYSLEHVSPWVVPIFKGPLKDIAFIEDDSTSERTIIELIFNHAVKYADKLYKKYYKDFCKDLCIEQSIDPITGSDLNSENKTCDILYKSISIYQNWHKHEYTGQLDYSIRKQLSEMITDLTELALQYKTNLDHIIDKIKYNKDMSTISIWYNEEQLSKFNNIWHNVVGLELYKFQNSKYNEYLQELKSKRIGLPIQLKKQDILTIIKLGSEKIDSSSL